jgi:outer membrane protein assembly factor BamA
VLHPLTWLDESTRPIFRSAEYGRLNELIVKPPGRHFKVGFGGTGSGSGFGPKVILFHNDVLGRRIEIETPLVITYNRYEDYQFITRFSLLDKGALFDELKFDISGDYLSRVGQNFFGIGNDSLVTEKSRFRSVTRELVAGLTAKFDDTWSAGLHGGHRNIGITKPRSSRSAQTVFTNAGVAGLTTGAALGSVVLSIERNTKDGNMASRGRQHLEISLHEDMGRADFSYWKYRLDIEQLIPIDRDSRKVIAFRGMFESNQEKGDSQIPFFDLATLGTQSTLRGFENFRFYDKSAMSFGVEYRYRIWRVLEWGLFVDGGQVAPEPGDFGSDRFHAAYGMRLIGWLRPNRPVSVDVARSNEAWRFYVNFNPSF